MVQKLVGRGFGLGRIFTDPVVPGVLTVLAGLIFGLGEMQSRPIRAQVQKERGKQLERESAFYRALNQYTDTIRQDNAAEMRSWERKLLQDDGQVQAVMDQIAGWMRESGWKGELRPRAEDQVSPDLPQLYRIGLGVEMVSPKEYSALVAEKDQVRLFRILRKVGEISAPHLIRRIEVDQTPNGEMRARLELEFFRLKADGESA